MLVMALAFVLVPVGSAWADPTDEETTAPAGSLCPGEPAPQPEAAGSGSDGLLVPPQSQDSIASSPDGLPPDASVYGQYGTAGQQWHVIRESCVDKMGSSAVATLSNSAWDLSKTINQSTITVYQAATSEGLLESFNALVESAVVELREGLWRPLLPTVIILGAVWLGWYGLIRKRVTLTIESAVWMVLATAIGMWILVNPSQILGYAGTLVNSGSQLVNSAASKMTVPGVGNVCPAGAPEPSKADWESESEFAVRNNSQMLWSGLVCRPWIAGEFGTGPVANTAVREHGMELLQAQGISRAEQDQIAKGEIEASELISEKQSDYEEIAASIEDNYPEIYPLFEGNQAGSRLGVATLALFAAVFAGGLILVGSVALIVLKIGFLLLLLLAPVFLLIGIHPGYGRTVLLRWFEMLLGLLLKQIFVVLLISLLVMSYSMVMVTNLAWGLQMILLALFTLALFIYRKPFVHLFTSVNANTFTSRMVSDAMQSRVLSQSANVLPPVAYMRAQRWGLRRAPQLAAAAGGVPAGPGGGADQQGGQVAGAGAAEQGEGEGVAGARSEGRRVRGTTGYGRARGKSGPPPLKLSGNESAGAEQRTGSSTSRPSAEAPSLGNAAYSGGVGSGSSSAPPSSGGPIPPRPAGGYRGTGDTGWASVFGTGSGSGQRPASGRSEGGNERTSGAPSPTSGSGIFAGREPARPEGNTNGRSRWGEHRSRREKAAPPPRQPRQPAARGGEDGHWFKSSGRRDPDRPISPFWTGSEGQRRANRDVPFWLRDSDS
ncbi:type IV secretion system protein [Nocardiopsis potens]|uniref:type IV secretion system protein n=1 Tax=Nocardiopsis potens TaxID=1246458 RepID=UPI00059537FA|nr:type IV secretion system protein [Nocardiopsis potens]